MKDSTDLVKYAKDYAPGKLWEKLTNVAKAAGLKTVYLVLLLQYVATSPEVSKADKLKIYGALGYFILPLDLIPDAIPVMGFTDDFAALLWVVRLVWVNITPDMKERAKAKLHEWFGEFDESVLDNVMNWGI